MEEGIKISQNPHCLFGILAHTVVDVVLTGTTVITMDSSNSTVMGPASSSHPTNYVSPPLLNTSIDNLRWREDAKMWTETVKTVTEAGDTKAT